MKYAIRVIIATILVVALGGHEVGRMGHAAEPGTDVVDEFFFDRRASGASGAVVLTSGMQYTVEVQGAYSEWVTASWDQGTCVGTAEEAPLYPSAGVTNGLVGVDPVFLFAAPEGSSACSSSAPLPRPYLHMEFAVATGDIWFVPNYQPPSFDTSHTYRFDITGTDAVLRVRNRPDNLPISDNYGQLRIRVMPLAGCVVPDADGDGVPDVQDRCAGTGAGLEVDAAGCSQAQFCGAVDAIAKQGGIECKKSDWKNDEPLMKPKRDGDCTIDKGGKGRDDDMCVPR